MNSRLILCGIMVFATAAAQGAGNIEAGKAKSAVCAACHGTDGNSANPEWPNLAGQHASYLVAQLQAYKSGDRVNVLMSPMAANLSDEDMADLAAYFSAQEARIGQADPALVEAGERLYRGGNATTGVPACMACHGPNGSGVPGAAYPALSGQHAAYTASTLEAYKSGARKGGQAAIMQTIATQMSPAEIEAVSNYIQGLH